MLSSEIIDEMKKEIKKYKSNQLDLRSLNKNFEKISAYFIDRLISQATEISKKSKGVLYYTEDYKNQLEETFTRFIR